MITKKTKAIAQTKSAAGPNPVSATLETARFPTAKAVGRQSSRTKNFGEKLTVRIEPPHLCSI
jgi:hypothetical protein